MPRNKFRYGIIGSGRLASHFAGYFRLLDISFTQWSRRDSIAVEQALSDCDVILILISDDAIQAFVDGHPGLKTSILVHCSGSRTIRGAWGAHPLMTFSNEPYSLEQYRSIPFVCEESENASKADSGISIGIEAAETFSRLFPGLDNPVVSIPADKKPLYHALCVLAGNFSTLLWNAAATGFRGELNIDPNLLTPYMKQITENFISRPETALTGPLVRGDRETLKKNKDALKEWNPAAAGLFQAFVDYYAAQTTAVYRTGRTDP